MTWQFLNTHKSDIRLWVLGALLHLIYFSVWFSADDPARHKIEHHSVTFAMVSSIVFYTVVLILFYRAQKTRLNKALALNKTYWDILILGIGLPAHTDWYTPMPQITRAYVWLGIAATIFWVLIELWIINRHRLDAYPLFDRRQQRRRAADRMQDQIVARYIERYGHLEEHAS